MEVDSLQEATWPDEEGALVNRQGTEDEIASEREKILEER